VTRYILDASFIADALVDERLAVVRRFDACMGEARHGVAQLLEPPILRPEFANLISRSKKLAHPARLTQAFAIFSGLPIEYRDFNTNQLWDQVVMARELRQTVYDCSYHRLAFLVGGTFLTCDKKYFEAAKHLGSIELV
jgi:predicted nucleic acid-binding protein